ncbi:hypothetical protein AAMO2058_000647300 [Amorphochlora amoebiformis]
MIVLIASFLGMNLTVFGLNFALGGGLASAALAMVASSFMCFNVTTVLTAAKAMYFTKIPKKALTGWHQYSSMVIFPDIDFNDHMNNARYNKALGMARLYFVVQSGLWQCMLRLRVKGGLKAVTIRFRREIKPFTRYKILSRLAGWDERSLFYEHKFVTSQKDGEFVNAYAVTNYTFSRKSALKPLDVIKAIDPVVAEKGCHLVPVLQRLREFEQASSEDIKAKLPGSGARGDNRLVAEN